MILKNNNTLSSKLSIKSQAIAIVLIGIALMVFLLSIFTSYVVNQQAQQMMLKNAFQITEGLAKQAVFPILSGAKENAETAMAQVLGFESVIAARLRINHNEIFIDKSNYDIPIAVKTYRPVKTEISEETDSTWLVSTPVKVAGELESEFNLIENSETEEIIGYAEVLVSKVNMLKSQQKVTFIIFLVGIFSAIILTTLLYLGLTKLFNPLNTLANTMETAEKTGEHALVEIHGAKEIQNMAHSYNNMMTVLEKQEESIIKHRDKLEKEVYIRTQELVQARDAALTANRHKSEFMANMSHELRTPIQSIIGYGELITEELEVEGNFELIEDMDKINNNAQRLLTMINSLLDLAKIEAGKLDINITEVDISSLISSLKDIIAPIAQKNTNQLTFHTLDNISKVLTDKEKMEQILINLLTNACKFTERGQVSLTIKQEKNKLRFDISDTGIGLTHEQQNYIFDEFRQVDASQSRKFSGTGLGLAISLRFVELLGGEIKVISEINKGTTFSVFIPFIQS